MITTCQLTSPVSGIALPSCGIRPFMNCPVYRHALFHDVKSLVELHQAAFPGFFLTSLGHRFLRLLYRSLVDAESGVCIVAENGQGVLGFAVGTTEPDAFFKTLLRKQGLSFAVATVPALLRHPAFAVRRCLGALCYRGEKPKAFPKAALLSSLAVSPDAARQGIGRELLDAFCNEVTRRGGHAVYLTTDASGNDAVNQFYEKCGFHCVDTFERPGRRRMNRWAKTLGLPIAPPNEAARRVDHVASSTL